MLPLSKFLSSLITLHLLLGPLHDRLVLPRGQDLDARLGDEQRVLELRAAGAVPRHRRPVVRPGAVLPAAQVDHGLDGEDVPLLHGPLGLVLRVVRHVGRRVEERPDAVAAVAAHDAAAVLLRAARDGRPEVRVVRARPAHVHGHLEALEGALHELAALLVHGAHEERLVQVRVEPADVHRHIDVDDVAVLQRALIGDAVADHLKGGRLWGWVRSGKVPLRTPWEAVRWRGGAAHQREMRLSAWSHRAKL
mmetsp:Transcript_20646/g.62820  ORF Transcript_20646/g.62820 Transcript_20646/m.62820 type:complete len:250 (-) Transcript_20646:1121-1870(-)